MVTWRSRRATAVIALGCCAVLFFGINTIADRLLRDARVDLTERGTYTLSSGTLATLARLDEPITVSFYFSKRLGETVPNYGAHARHVQEMLEEYAIRANGELKLRVIDPEPYSPEEDRAVALGVRAEPIDSDGGKVYFGIAATNSTDDEEVIPFLRPERERLLEYDLTRMIHALAVPRKTRLGLISGLPLEGDMVAAAMQGKPMQPFAIMDKLGQLYDVRGLGGDIAAVPDDIDVLMLVHPQALTDAAEYAIDQYVLKGGKALVFLDPLSEFELRNPTPVNAPDAPTSSTLDRLTTAWGVAFDSVHVVADRVAARRVKVGGPTQVRAVDYIGWLALREANFNHDDPVTADLNLVHMATAGAIEPIDGARTKFEPLISTSLSAMKMPVAEFNGRPDFAGLLAEFKPEGRSFALAARVTGPAETAFPAGPPKPPPANDGAAASGAPSAGEAKDDATGARRLKTSSSPIDIILVGDTDMLSDRFWVRVSGAEGEKITEAAANNFDFVANAIDSLAGGTDLASLRARGAASRPFERVEALRRAAEDRYSAEERALQETLKDTRARLGALQAKGPAGAESGGGIVLTEDQSDAIDTLRAESLRTRRQLRSVRAALDQDVDRLRRTVEFVDIAGAPILVVLGALALGAARRRQRARAARIKAG